MRADAQQLGQTSHPHDVRLQDVDGTALDQAAEPVAGVLVLAARPGDGGAGALDLDVPFHVVGVQHLFPPVDVELPAALGQTDRVRHAERHVAIDHQREVRTHPLAVGGEERPIVAKPALAVVRPVRQGNLPTEKTHRLRRIRCRSRAVEVDRLARRPADQLADRLLACLADRVPQREVDDADRRDRQALAPVEHRGAVHLVPHPVGVAHVLPDDEASEVVLDQPAGGLAAEAGGNADGTVGELDLDDDRAEHADAPARAARLVPLVTGHRVRDHRVDEPVALRLTVVVPPFAIARDGVDAQLDDLPALAHSALRSLAGFGGQPAQRSSNIGSSGTCTGTSPPGSVAMRSAMWRHQRCTISCSGNASMV